MEQQYVSPLLTGVAVDYKNREFVADRLAPAVTVPQKSFKWREWNRDSKFKPVETKYGPNGEVNLLDFGSVLKDGSVDYHGLGAYTDQDEILQLGPGIPVQAFKTGRLTESIQLAKEIATMTMFTTQAFYGAQLTALGGANLWSADTSDPEADVDAAKDAMIIKPNVAWGGRQVISRLRRHPKIIDRVKYTQKGKVPIEALLDLFEVEEIISCDAFQDTAARGQAESRAYIWGKNFGLCYRNPNPLSPGLQDLTFAATPTLKQAVSVPGGKAPTYAVYVAPPHPSKGTGPGSEFIKVDTSYKPLIQAAPAGWLFPGAIA